MAINSLRKISKLRKFKNVFVLNYHDNLVDFDNRNGANTTTNTGTKQNFDMKSVVSK